MIDNFALLVSHGLMMIAAVLLMRRPDLDREGPAVAAQPPRAIRPRPGKRPRA